LPKYARGYSIGGDGMSINREIVAKYKDRCLSCKHWGGNREDAWNQVNFRLSTMDLETGECPEGECAVIFREMFVETPDATYREVSVNFGCILHDSIDIDE
jgi:hypothetical protein